MENIHNTYAVVQKIDFSPYQRVIAISDIHGDCQGFDGVLKKVGFSEKDALRPGSKAFSFRAGSVARKVRKKNGECRFLREITQEGCKPDKNTQEI